MDLGEIKKIIQQARDAVKDEDETNRFEIFKIVLEKLLEEHVANSLPTRSSTPTTAPLQQTQSIQPTQSTSVSTGMEELANNCGITVKELEDIVTLKNNEVEVIANFTGNEGEKQVNVSQCVLITHEIVLKEDWVKTSAITEALRKNGRSDLAHLSRNLKKQTKIFRMRGEGKGAEYKLTTQGRTTTCQLIRSLVKGV